MAEPVDHTYWPLVSKLLDWPFLLFVLLLIVMRQSGQTLGELIKGRKIDVEVGGNKFSVGEAIQALDDQALNDFKKLQQEIDPIKARLAAIEAERGALEKVLGEGGAGIDELRSKIEELRTATPPTGAVTMSRTSDHDAQVGAAAERRDAIVKRLIYSLSHTRFDWRTIERLAIEAGVTENEAHEILAAHPNEFRLGKSKTGKAIAKLASR